MSNKKSTKNNSINYFRTESVAEMLARLFVTQVMNSENIKLNKEEVIKVAVKPTRESK